METKTAVRDRLRYRIDNFFSRGGTSIFLALIAMFAVTFCIMGSVRLVLNMVYPDPIDSEFREWGNIIWRTALQVVDIGSLGEDSGASFHNRTVGVITSLIGLALISTMLAFVTSLFKEKLEALRRGKSAVLEKDHTIILGFGIRTIEIIRELIEANASEKDAAVIVLSELDKEKMDDTLSDYLTDTATTRIVTRTGSTSNPLALKKIGVQNARSVIILNPAGPANPPEIKSKADYRVLKSIMAVAAAVDGGPAVPVVARLHFQQNRKLAEGNLLGHIETIDEEQILAKILVQTSRTPGLTAVYSDLVGFLGNEVYFCSIPDRYHGLNFGEFAFYFRQSVPLGLKSRAGAIELNPDPLRVIEEGDEAIVLAEDDSTIHFHEAAVVTPRIPALSGKRKTLSTEHYLIFGWSTKSPVIIHEYGCYISGDSVIDVVVADLTEDIRSRFEEVAGRHPGIRMSIRAVDAMSPEFPAQLKPENYQTVVILAGQDNNIEEIDAETISVLLKFRHYLSGTDNTSGSGTQLIAEVMDSENVEIMQHAGVKDFVISNQFVSKIMAQISQEPRVSEIYDILFKAEGSEIYLKSADLYLEELPARIRFADLMAAAQTRKEVCFGVRISENNGPNGVGSRFFIIPDKETVFELHAADHLITLALDET